MVDYTVWMIEAAQIAVSGGGSLDGVTQGDGSHLVGRTLTLTSAGGIATTIRDNDTSFEDNDTTQQTLVGSQTINGVTYSDGTRVEAEYRIILTDPETGQTWTAYAYNVNNTNPAYATIEGLMLRPNADGAYPPVGKALTVTFASEGPSGLNSNLYDLYDTPPCFVPGTRIDTARGPVAIEALRPGDLVRTRDNGLQVLRWVGEARLSARALRENPAHQPIRLRAGTLGEGLPARALCLSPQHRVLVTGWRAQILFGEDEVLVPALSFLGDRAWRIPPDDHGVRYLHLLFDRHEIIFAEGAPVESLMPGWLTDARLPPALRAELTAILPQAFFPLAAQHAAARSCLTVPEGRLLA